MDSNSLKTFFDSDKKSHILLNPRRPAHEKSWVDKAQIPNWPEHLWISSSGTTSANEVKLIGLSRQAFLVAAKAANEFLNVSSGDVWLNVLPHFHVGGLAIFARAYLSKSKVIDISTQTNGDLFKWNPHLVVDEIIKGQVTLLSLVPTQVYDLVRLNIPSPPSLRAVLVGGGLLQDNLYRQARDLGWPLLPTFGMSELCSQVATVPLASLNENSAIVPPAHLLSHIQARTTKDSRLEIKSAALLSAYVYASEKGSRLEDPKKDGWFLTSDFAELSGAELRFKGRLQDQIKVGGEVVNLARLQGLFQTLIQDVPLAVLAEADDRLEARVVIVFESISPRLAEKYIEVLNKNVAPYERIQGLYIVEVLPRTDLGKIKTGLLKEQLGCF